MSGAITTDIEQVQGRDSWLKVAKRLAIRWSVAAIILYLACSLLLFSPVLEHPFTAVMGKSDGNLFVWWLKWVPWAIGHGHNPLYTYYLNAPVGVNGMWNTSITTIALLAAPITLTLGPVFSANLLFIIAPVVTGFTFFLVIRRYVQRQWVALVGGLLFAFIPFQLAHEQGHLNLSWNFLPPLLLLFLDEIFVRQRMRSWLLGLLFGAVIVLQAGASTELLAVGGVAFAVGMLVLALRWPKQIRPRLKYATIVIGIAGATTLALFSYPLYMMFFGPGIPRVAIRTPGFWVGDLPNLIVPTSVQEFRPLTTHLPKMRTQAAEQGLYLGPSFLLLIVLATITIRRSIVRLTAAAGLILLIACLGPVLIIFNKSTDILLPWKMADYFPLLEHLLPVRFSLYTGFCAAVLLALWLDWLADQGRQVWVRVSGLALAAVSLIMLVPHRFYPDPIPMPEIIKAGEISKYVAPSDAIKIMPRAGTDGINGGWAMSWQALNGFSYRLQSGYFIGGDQKHSLLLQTPPDAYDKVAKDVWGKKPVPPLNDPVYGKAAQALRDSKVRAIVLVPLPKRNNEALKLWTQRVTGLPGQHVKDGWIFVLPR